MPLVTGGLLGPTLLTRGFIGTILPSFRRALRAKLRQIPDLVAIVGSAIYPGAVPFEHDLINGGPALAYNVFRFRHGYHTEGSNLSGSDGTILARVRLSAFSTRAADVDLITVALYAGLEGILNAQWSDVPLVTCIHMQEIDLSKLDKVNGIVYYHIDSEYDVRYRIAVPVHS